MAAAALPAAAQTPAARRPKGISPLKITDAKTLSAGGYEYFKIYTDGGVTGIGEPSHSNGELNAAFLDKLLKPLILGMDAFEIEKIWEKMYIGSYKIRGQAATIAMSGVDIAIHDIVGKALGVPVYQLLGGLVRDPIPMYASFTSRERSPAEQARLCAQAVEQGFPATKIKIAARHGYDEAPRYPDEQMVREVRAAIGEKTRLMVDANSGYSVPRAITMGRFLESQNVFWFEEPVPFTDHQGTAKVAAALDVAIAGGEQDHTRYDFHKLIAAEACDILQADPIKAGGLSECKKIAALIDASDRYYVPHNTSHALGLVACLHIIASTPCCRYANEFVLEGNYRKSALTEPLIPVKGMLQVPKGPGLGVEIKE
jgi:L-alanine-DL-glutamate epimerase-like enolase superfamily enzyme